VIRIRYWILVGLLALAACSSGQQTAEDKGVNDRARIAAEYIAKGTAVAHLKEAADQVFPDGYKLEELPILPLNCTAGGTLYGLHYAVRKIDPEGNEDYFDRMKQYWQAFGWRVENDARPYDMFMNATRFDYLMSIQGGITGQITIGESTPCV